MIRVAIVVLALFLAAAVPIVADRPLPKADLTVYNGRGATTLDPQRMSWSSDLRVARCLYEPLVRHDVLTHEQAIVPGVAESWTVSDDGRVYTFTFDENARWSNGDRVRPTDFVFAWRRAILPDLVADYAQLFFAIEGAREFFDWRTAALDRFAETTPSDPAEQAAAAEALWQDTLAEFDRRVGLDAPDDRTLVVTLERPLPYFLDLAAFGVFSPVYPPLVERYERPNPRTGRLDRRTGWTKPGVHVGNGPFALRRWRFKRDMRLEANPHYRDPDALDIRSIDIPDIADPNAAVLAFQTGAVDFMAEVSASYRGELLEAKRAHYDEHAGLVADLRAQGLDPLEIDRRLPEDDRAAIHAIPSFGTYFWNFNCQPTLPDGRPNPFADPRVRRAFAMAIDKRAIADEIRRLGEPVAGTFIPPGSIAGYESPEGLPCVSDADTDEGRAAIIADARALLAEAGYPEPAQDFPIVVELLFNKDAGHDLVAQKIAKDWSGNLGVGVSLAQKELKVYREELSKGNFITSRAGWYGDYADPTTFLDLNRTGDGNNDRKYSNPDYDALLDLAADERDPGRRLDILAEAERMLIADELPLIPIFHYSTVVMFDPHRLTGVSTHPRNKQVFAIMDVLGDGVGRDIPKPMRHADRPGTAAATPGAPR